MNSGTPEQAREAGALMYVGQPDHNAGHVAEMCAKGDGVASSLIVNHRISSPSSTERFADGLGIELGNQMIDTAQDPAELKNFMLANLLGNPDPGAVLTLGRPWLTRRF